MTNKIDMETATRAVAMFLKVDRLHKKAFEGMVRELGIHQSQHRMLMSIAEDSTITQTDLSAQLEVSPAAVAVAIKKLEQDGFLKRRMSERDNRFNEIELTEKGRAAVDSSKERFYEIDSAMLNGISKEEVLGFIKCLEVMQENLMRFCGETEENDS